MTAYKLFKVRKDGTLGPLYINARQHVPVGVWLKAESHPTKGFAVRHGWHCTAAPVAPHLTEKGRRWYLVEIEGVETKDVPKHQGSVWYMADRMRVMWPVCHATE